jgi:hypothetical protein
MENRFLGGCEISGEHTAYEITRRRNPRTPR